MPRVSVVIPTYNRADLVPLAVESALGQTFVDLEVIVIDDGSTDNTAEVLRGFGQRLRLITRSNDGLASARNRGIMEAAGQFVAFLDSDDIWLPHKVERQVAVFDAEPEVGLVYTQAYWMNAAGLVLNRPPHGHDQSELTPTAEMLVVGNLVCGGGSGAMVRRSCFDTVGLFDERVVGYEDWDMWLRISLHFRLRLIPEPLVCYRINPNGFRTWAPRPEQADHMHQSVLAVQQKAFSSWPENDPRQGALKGHVHAREYLRQALVNYDIGRVVEGRTDWIRAIELDPKFASDRAVVVQAIVDAVAGMAATYPPAERIDVVQQAVDRILDNLPAQVQWLRLNGHQLLARVLVEVAFVAAQNQEVALARRAAWKSLTLESSWWSNQGLLKVLLTGGRHLWPISLDDLVDSGMDPQDKHTLRRA